MNGHTSQGITNQTSIQNENGESKEEKLRKRREQLLAWRQKKEQEKEQEKIDADEKKRIRQQRIEEWKRARAQQSQEPVKKPDVAKPISARPTLTLKKTNKTTAPLKRPRVVLQQDDQESDSAKPKFKKPTLDQQETPANDDAPEVDELDLYLASLSETKNTTKVQLDEPDDLDEEEEVDEEQLKQQKLLTSLTKLQTKGKELKPIDHTLETYAPFRKSFYQQPYELQMLTQEQISEIRKELGNVRVKGNNASHYAPISKWSHLGLPSNLSTVITDKLQFESPSAIQCQALPIIMSGRDVIGVAKTGSGKTLSYVIPMLRHIQDQPPIRENDGPIGVVLCPTRELALQIQRKISNFTSKSLRVCCCYGGSSIEPQINELKSGVEIIVGTPGRVIDLLAANSGRVTNLQRTTYIVLDEADRMFDLGFEPQISKIFTQIRPDRQTILFSATFPRKMEQLAKHILVDPVEIIVGGISVVAPEITQKIILFENVTAEEFKSDRIDKLHSILADYQTYKKVLIFVEKQNDADDLVTQLLAFNLPCVAIHGGKDQLDRRYAIKEFSSINSGVDILIATSVAARGLDVKSLGLVINFDPPNHMEDYVHRVGRTGRAGSKGTAITFVWNKQEHEIANLVRALRMSKVEEIDSRLVEIAESFSSKVKQGKEKIHYGFGGKGLDKLKQVRDSKLQMEKNMYDESTTETVKEKSVTPNATPNATAAALPDFEIIEGNSPETSGPDKCKFYSRIIINDLPQAARWNIVNREHLSKIIETSRTSITTRGQFYPPGKNPPPNNKDSLAKLYLLVEGLDKSSVHEANNMIRERMIEGLELAAQQETNVPGGRYVV
ncbi:uncharacterized protein SPAPADRAFT_155409 [Spathaspora passalidarum NRRL Y-27907]|uniref:RNA helicase n=1 Tax=Spathaspora passalidarum (strain NRRL Y-27907 / 11-Y1) TaxID=619300 RepID=G3ARM8_SPAPN|nr:uncharacterized protein SPAPADRAFT_155409 [Spathaspora passalidarum NRRL Y-27907]EGW31781.1 hypothetical protein SPAPADRAFT_155409 [Spathaspora passalidarum NRRL Y-27907]